MPSWCRLQAAVAAASPPTTIHPFAPLKHREAQENGEYAEAFWLCAQCVRSMEELGDGLRVAQQVGRVGAALLLLDALSLLICRLCVGLLSSPLTVADCPLALPPRHSIDSNRQLTVTINRLYSDTTARLEGALAAVCGDFRPSHYTKVLEGYMFLGDVAQVGAGRREGGAAVVERAAAAPCSAPLPCTASVDRSALPSLPLPLPPNSTQAAGG